MENSDKIFLYLPTSYKDPKEESYVNLVWKFFSDNYEKQNWDLCYLAYHQLFMGVVYFNIFQLKQSNPKEYDKIEIKFKGGIQNKTSPFGFSEISEAAFIDNLIHFENLSKEKIGQYQAKLKIRNKIPHFNGLIEVNTEAELEIYVNQYLKHCQEIQDAGNEYVLTIYKDFIQKTVEQRYLNEEIEKALELAKQPPAFKDIIELYSSEEGHIKEKLIHQNYFSWKDIETCINTDLSGLFKEPEKLQLKAIYRDQLKGYYNDNCPYIEI